MALNHKVIGSNPIGRKGDYMGKKRFKNKKYVKKGGSICPYCESYDITVDGNPLFDANYVSQDVKCDDCGSEWRDVYTLSFAEEKDSNT